MTNKNSKAARSMLPCIALLTALFTFEAAAQGVDASPSESLRVQEIRCAGNNNTSCEFIREKLYLNRG